MTANFGNAPALCLNSPQPKHRRTSAGSAACGARQSGWRRDRRRSDTTDPSRREHGPEPRPEPFRSHIRGRCVPSRSQASAAFDIAGFGRLGRGHPPPHGLDLRCPTPQRVTHGTPRVTVLRRYCMIPTQSRESWRLGPHAGSLAPCRPTVAPRRATLVTAIERMLHDAFEDRHSASRYQRGALAPCPTATDSGNASARSFNPSAPMTENRVQRWIAVS